VEPTKPQHTNFHQVEEASLLGRKRVSLQGHGNVSYERNTKALAEMKVETWNHSRN